jgi:chromosome partitioning protein
MHVELNHIGRARMSKITLDEVTAAAQVARSVLEANIEQLKPWTVAAMLDVTEPAIQNVLARNKDAPKGRRVGEKSRNREFSVAETRAICRLMRGEQRPKNAPPFVVCIGGFKGGTGKSTTTAALTHLLTARGHKVLAIDTDPQGSLASILTGKVNHDPEMSLEPFFQGAKHHDGRAVGLLDLVQPTCWEGLDVIISHPRLFLSEVALTMRGQSEDGFLFWKQLKMGIDGLGDSYDVVIIDTAPVVSFTSLNCYAASNLFIQPLPLGGLEFLSCVEFWDLVSVLFNQIRGSGFEFNLQAIGLLPYKTKKGADNLKAIRHQELVRRSTNAGYPNWLLPYEIPDSKLAERLGLSLKSAAELGPEDATKTAHLSLLRPFVETTNWIETNMDTFWGK